MDNKRKNLLLTGIVKCENCGSDHVELIEGKAKCILIALVSLIMPIIFIGIPIIGWFLLGVIGWAYPIITIIFLICAIFAKNKVKCTDCGVQKTINRKELSHINKKLKERRIKKRNINFEFIGAEGK